MPGPTTGWPSVSGGLLHVGVRQATPDFRGWFLTTTGTTPSSVRLPVLGGIATAGDLAGTPGPWASW